MQWWTSDYIIQFIAYECVDYITVHWLLFSVVLIPIFQQTATSTSFSQCGRNVGTRTRAWCIICGSVNVGRSSLGDLRPWLKQSSLCWKKDCPCPRLLGNMTSHTPRLCCMPIVCTTCWDLQLMAVQVIFSLYIISEPWSVKPYWTVGIYSRKSYGFEPLMLKYLKLHRSVLFWSGFRLLIPLTPVPNWCEVLVTTI